ncbi:DUF2917 domain-containing protein [Polaromonas sp. CG_9.11]|uniref:DUF2917 domain-containing protein n=1 Tax=Polaromonas sp. CG_9.11 TaxID=2787730 RepID=UPI0018CBA95D|nr:DUF2917 domain-containing protein [Polaromonas sp. CG_9.11]MBG6078215.1 hypothetical protein [Polaromonas sp. CG_9.11]
MNNQSNHFDLSVERNALFNVPDAAGMRIVCREGAVWITLDNDPNDYVLEAGDIFSNTEHKRALIYAMRPSSIAVTAGTSQRPSDSRLRAGALHGLVFEQVLA